MQKLILSPVNTRTLVMVDPHSPYSWGRVTTHLIWSLRSAYLRTTKRQLPRREGIHHRPLSSSEGHSSSNIQEWRLGISKKITSTRVPLRSESMMIPAAVDHAFLQWYGQQSRFCFILGFLFQDEQYFDPSWTTRQKRWSQLSRIRIIYV